MVHVGKRRKTWFKTLIKNMVHNIIHVGKRRKAAANSSSPAPNEYGAADDDNGEDAEAEVGKLMCFQDLDLDHNVFFRDMAPYWGSVGC